MTIKICSDCVDPEQCEDVGECLNYGTASDDDSKVKKGETTYEVCPVCNGLGQTVNPNIDAHGLTAEDFRDDPDFKQEYFSGMYNIACGACKGKRVITKERLEELEQNAEDRKLAARENGDWESYRVAGDYRYG
jgi:hypothetical protein